MRFIAGVPKNQSLPTKSDLEIATEHMLRAMGSLDIASKYYPTEAIVAAIEEALNVGAKSNVLRTKNTR